MARARSKPSGRASELVGLVAFALAALLAISLFTFDPLDRSFFTASPSSRGPTRNLAGTVGANLSHGLLVLLGVLAYAAPLALVVVGVRRLRAVPTRPRALAVVGGLGLWLSLSALLAVSLGDVRFRGSDGTVLVSVFFPAGGLVGQALASGLVRLLGPAGSLVVLLSTFAGSLLLTTTLSLSRTLDRVLSGTESWWTRMVTAVGRQLARRKREGERLAAERQKREARELSRAVAEREKREADERSERERREARDAVETRKREAREAAERERQLGQEQKERERQAAQEQKEREKQAVRDRAVAEQEAIDAARAASLALKEQAEREQERAIAEAAARGAAARRAPPVPLGDRKEPSASDHVRGTAATLRLPADAPPSPAEPRGTTLPASVANGASAAAAPAPSPSRPSAAALAAAAVASRSDAGRIAGAAPAAAAAASPALAAASAHAALFASSSPPTPRDVATLAAEASGALRKARAEKAEAELRRRPVTKAAIVEDFALPPLSLLETLRNDAVVTERELVENAKVLVAKLKEFAVDGTVQAINPGPVVTTYEYRPEAGVKYSKIVGLADDLCLAMKAEGVRIDRISGKSAVGIEVPNSVRETIGLREMLEAEPFQKSTSKLTLTLGKGINGEPYITDLRKMPHLLIAGATGSGKSVAVNCMIVSVLYKATPEEVKFIMVDPKRIELGVYDGIPHLLVPVVTDCRLASNALRWAVVEMENRYKKLASLGVRSLEQYNSHLRGPEAKKLAETATSDELAPLPYIIILIDELADLMMVAANDVEDSISRLAAMARAVGIHLVLATQRPSVDVITGVIKANFPSRISFRVSSKVDSRTILDSNGAEMLLGKGDMLFMPPGSARLLRVHGAFISDGEVQRLVNYLKNQRDPEYNDQVLHAPETASDEFEGEMDEMYDEAVRVVLETGQASVSHLQRRLRLGYSRAARLVDIMELNGIVGPSQGAKGREILVDRAQYLSQMAP